MKTAYEMQRSLIDFYRGRLSSKLLNWSYHQEGIWDYLFWPVFLAELLGAALQAVGL
jgi:hypothetical protein